MSAKLNSTLSALQAKKQLCFVLEGIFNYLSERRTNAEEALEGYKAKNEEEERSGWWDSEIDETEKRISAIDAIVAHLAKLL